MVSMTFYFGLLYRSTKAAKEKLCPYVLLPKKESVYHQNSLQNPISVEIQLESRKCPVGKFLFPNWKIIFSQLENHFFPVGLFLGVN